MANHNSIEARIIGPEKYSFEMPVVSNTQRLGTEQWRLVDAETHRLYVEWVAQGKHDGSPSWQAYSAQWDAQYELRDKIEALRATTVQGVLALFEVAEAEGAEDEGIFHRCFEAGIASLREIAAREAQP